MADCRDAWYRACLCRGCFHGGCCLRTEHLRQGSGCPMLECPDYRPAGKASRPESPDPPEAPKATTSTAQKQAKPLAVTMTHGRAQKIVDAIWNPPGGVPEQVTLQATLNEVKHGQIL